MGLLSPDLEQLIAQRGEYQRGALANYQPQPEEQGVGFLEALGQAFIPQTMARIAQMKVDRNAPRQATYQQLAEYYAPFDPERSKQYAELAQAQSGAARTSLAPQIGVNPETQQPEYFVMQEGGVPRFTGVVPQQKPAPVSQQRVAAPRLPTGMMWDAEAGRAIPVPGVPQKVAAAQAASPQVAKPQAQKPLSSKEQDALFEAEDNLASSRQAISALDKALELNEKAFSGLTAKPRALLQSQFGGGDRADATVEFDSLIQGQALASLKSIFGGNPTEGERRILMDLQASVEKTPAQRKAIIERARQAAVDRVSRLQQRTQGIVTRTPQVQQPKIKRYNPATGRIE